MQYRLSDFTWGQKRREREEGNSSVVYKVVRKLDNVLCALKIIRGQSGVVTEVAIIEELSTPGHPNIIKYFGCGKITKEEIQERKLENYYEGATFIVTEWVEGVTLEMKIKDISLRQNQRRLIFTQLIKAIQYLKKYLQSKNINHRDIYPRNILLSFSKQKNIPPKLVLCDFGSADYISKDSVTRDQSQCGMILLTLYSNINLNPYTWKTYKIADRDAFSLARDLIAAQNSNILENIFSNSFFTKDIFEVDFVSIPCPWAWGDDVVEKVAAHLVNTGSTKDFINASLVCKNFYLVFQETFLSTFKPYITKSVNEDEIDYAGTISTTPENFSLFVQKIFEHPSIHSWDTMNEYCDNDIEFEAEILNSYAQTITEAISNAKNMATTMTFSTQSWSNILCLGYYSIYASSIYSGASDLYLLGYFTNARIRNFCSTLDVERYESEIKLLSQVNVVLEAKFEEFKRLARQYLLENGVSQKLIEF